MSNDVILEDVFVVMMDTMNVITQVMVAEDKKTIKFINPVMYETIMTEEGDRTHVMPFLPGSIHNTFPVASSKIIVFDEATIYFKRIYGSALMKFAIQRAYHDAIAANLTELDDATKMMLESYRIELISKFGMIDEDEFRMFEDSNRTMH